MRPKTKNIARQPSEATISPPASVPTAGPPAGGATTPPAGRGAGGRPPRAPGGVARLAIPPPLRRYVARDDLRAAGEGNAFSNTEHDAQKDEPDKTADKAHQQGASRPQ